MRIDFAILADAVTVRENLVNVLGGGLTRIGSFPVPQGINLPTPFGPAVSTGARFMVGLRLVLARGELGRPHKFESKISLPDGGELYRMELELLAPVQQVPEGEEPAVCLGYSVALDAIPQLGPYSVDLFVDGSHLKALPFQIVLASSAPAGS